MRNIFDYFDYRDYLNDVFGDLQKKRSGYSYRVFSKETGISSHNFLPRILKRQRNLSDEFVPLLGGYFHLAPKEVKYFQCLAAFNNAVRPLQKERFLKQLLAMRVMVEEYKLVDRNLRFFEKWYYPVLRELVVICDFKEDYNVLARSCVPRISALQAKSAVKFLLQNGFIEREKNGRYRVADAIIASEPEVDSAIIPRYHRTTIQQCVAAVDSIKKEKRHFSSSTMLVSRELYEEMKKEIFFFRKRLLAMARECRNPEMVCFAGHQLMPRSEVIPAPKTPDNP